MFSAHQVSLTVKMTLAMSLKGDGEEMRIMLQEYTLFLILEVIGTIMSCVLKIFLLMIVFMAGRYSRTAAETRESFTNYFTSSAGEVDWQYQYVHRTN